MNKILSSFLLILLLQGCSTDMKAVNEQIVDNVDINRFMGKWYVIGNIPTIFEKGAHNATETYTWNEEKKRIDVLFRYFKDSFDGKKKDMTQKAWIFNAPKNSHWKVQIIWPFKLDYLVIDRDSEYRYVTVGVPGKQYVWLMAKEPQMSEELLEKAKNRIKSLGYDMSKFQLVPQKW